MRFFNNKENPYLADPDTRLMLAFQKGDKPAFESLMTKYYKRVLNFIYRFVGQSEIAEDLTQEVFIKIYHSAKGYSVKSKFQTWAFTIAKNISLNELRRMKRKTLSLDHRIDTGEGEVEVQFQDTKALSADEELIKSERVNMIKAAIDALPQNQRMAVLLRRYEMLSYEEIGQTMGLSVKAVKSLLNRAKENLKDNLAKLVND